MSVGRALLFGCAVLMLAGGAAAARPIPGLSESGSVLDTFEALATDAQLVDPVILEPLRPLLPMDDPAAAAVLVRPEPCGAMSPVVLALTFVSLGFMGGSPRFRMF